MTYDIFLTVMSLEIKVCWESPVIHQKSDTTNAATHHSFLEDPSLQIKLDPKPTTETSCSI